MRKKYLFTLIYLGVLALSFIVPNLGDLLFVLIAPVAVPISILSEMVGGPRDTAIPAMMVGSLQFFALGAIWDACVDWIKRQDFK